LKAPLGTVNLKCFFMRLLGLYSPCMNKRVLWPCSGCAIIVVAELFVQSAACDGVQESASKNAAKWHDNLAFLVAKGSSGLRPRTS
jgi:hypothetical protein